MGQKTKEHLDIISDFYTKWRLKVNPTKSTVTYVTFRKNIKNDPIYYQDVPVSTQVRYLGVILDSQLNYRAQVNAIVGMGKRALSMIYTYIIPMSPLSTKQKITLYQAYVRSVLLNAAPMWVNAASALLTKIQVIETKALRIIHNNCAYQIPNNDLYKLAGIKTNYEGNSGTNT